MMSAITHFCGELLSDISQCVTVGSIGRCVRIHNYTWKMILESQNTVECISTCSDME